MGTGKKRGRPSSAMEFNTATICRSAIEAKYETLEEGCKKLLESGEPVLIKWVFEHGLGKPQDKVDVTTNGKELPSTKEIVFRDYNDKA